jgi:hypothetical protein
MIFRARLRTYLLRASPIVMLVVPALYVMSRERGLLGFGLGLGAMLVSVMLVKEDLLPVWRANVVVSDHSISWRQGDRMLEIAVTDIIAASIDKDRLGHDFLLLATAGGVGAVAVQFLDLDRLSVVLAERLGPDRWGPANFERWAEKQPERQAAEQADAQAIQELSRPLDVHQPRWVTAIGWMGVVFFGSLAVLSFLDRSYGSAAAYLFFFALSALNALVERAELDGDGLTRHAKPLGDYSIRWDEVRRVEHSPMMEWIVLYGDDKHLAMMGPAYWSGPDATDAVAYFRAQIRKRNIPVRMHWSVQFKFLSRNTRIKQ